MNPNYAIEIANLPQIIGSWAFTAYASMHLWVHLKYNDHLVGCACHARDPMNPLKNTFACHSGSSPE
jgi:hypothetical protein